MNKWRTKMPRGKNETRNVSALTSLGYITSLCILLLNDFILKATFPGFWTGKISDFAGLFIFPMFFSAFFTQYRVQIYLLSAAAFVLWKSEIASFFLLFWNALGLFEIYRTQDYSDLLALSVLPLSYVCSKANAREHTIPAVFHKTKFPIIIAIVSVLAFCATSRVWVMEFEPAQYRGFMLKAERDLVLDRILEVVKLNSESYSAEHLEKEINNARSEKQHTIQIPIEHPDCSFVYSHIDVFSESEGTRIRVADIRSACKFGDADRQKLLDFFQQNYIEKLRIEFTVLD